VDAWWLAPVVALALSGIVFLVAIAAARRSSGALEAERPRLEAVAAELGALHADLWRVADRVADRARGAGTGTPAR
jgi:hypothetical protein